MKSTPTTTGVITLFKCSKMNSLGLAIFCVAVACASAGFHGAGIVAGHGSPAVIAGPSGTVVRGAGHGAVIAPAYAHGAVIAPAYGHAGFVAPGLITPGAIFAGPGYYGHGFEGQYIPDYTEHLYDDGSYKPHIYGH